MGYIALYIITENLLDQLEEYRRRTPQQILSGGAVIADKLENIAKRNAPWTDRTGNARRTMEGFQGFQDADHYHIGIRGNMPYSYQLERWYNRRYAILMPTMVAQKPHILDDIKAIISREENESS